MATAEEIIVKLTAENAQLKAGMAEGAAVVKATQDEMAASYANTMGVFQQFDAIQKTSIKTAQDAAAAQAVLTAAEKTGVFTTEELAAKQAILAAAMSKLPQEAEAASTGLAAALTRNSRVAYSTSALITDALTGQFSRSKREVAALANETGAMSSALRFLLGPVGLAAAGIAAVGFSAIEANRDLSDFQHSVQLTNGYLGVTAGEMQSLAENIGNLTNDYDDAKEAVIGLASSGQFTGAQLEQAATAAVRFAQLTGEKVSEVDKLIVEMATHPQKALDELVDKYHRITPAQADVIEGLIKEGNTGAATAALIQAMGGSVAASMDEQKAHTNALAKEWDNLTHSVGEFFRNFGRNVSLATGGGDAAQKIAQLREQMAKQVPGGATQKMLQAQIDALQKIIDKTHESAAAASKAGEAWKAAHPESGSFAALQQKGFGGIDLSGNLNKQLQDLEAAQKVSYGNREEFEREYWGTILHTAKAGTAAYVQAWQQVQTGQQRLDQQQLQDSQETARKQAQADREGAEAAKRQLEQEAEAAKKAAREKLAADEQVAENAHNLATARVDASMQGYKLEARAGQISAAELLRDQITALNQQLAADIRYYESKEKLAAGDAAEQMKWHALIAADQAKTEAAMVRAAKAYQAMIDRINGEIADEKIRQDQRMIMSGFREINQLITHQETFKQALANIGMEILQTQEENVARGIAEAFNGEQGKTAAVGAGVAERTALVVAGEARSLAVQGASAIKWITTEAAKAAAGAFNAMVSIPYIGPFVAVGASIAAGAAVLALIGKVASAEGGWERVPADGMTTVLHKDEMVLPAHIANPMREMTRKGGAMGGVHHHHYNIQAYDRRGLADFVARNGIELGNGLRRLSRNGHQL